MSIRTRFAPSPTGFLHVGSLRTALYEYAFAKSLGGRFVLRIEDTDRNRFVPGATESLCRVLKLFGIVWDEGPEVGGPYAPYIQSERVKTGIYKKYAQQLVDSGNAYYCFCPAISQEELEASHLNKKIELRDRCRYLTLSESKKRIASGEKAAIRLRVPDKGSISYYDFLLKKDVSWEYKNVDEAMLLKSDGFPTYHLAVVVDDVEMKINPILRAVEWIPSTPIHLLLFQYLGFEIPKIGHFTLILDPAGGKLSKRKGSVMCEEFLTEGYLPEAILNFIMLLGWAPKDNRELFTLKEFVKNFQKGELQTANPVFNRKKLDWFNGVYIRTKSDQELFNLLKLFAPKDMDNGLIKKTLPLVKDRMIKLSDYPLLTGFLFSEPKLNLKILLEKGGGNKELIKKQLTFSIDQLADAKPWKAETLEKIFRHLAAKNNWDVGHFFMATRIAITGKTATPPLFESLEILGRAVAVNRIKKAIKVLA